MELSMIVHVILDITIATLALALYNHKLNAIEELKETKKELKKTREELEEHRTLYIKKAIKDILQADIEYEECLNEINRVQRYLNKNRIEFPFEKSLFVKDKEYIVEWKKNPRYLVDFENTNEYKYCMFHFYLKENGITNDKKTDQLEKDIMALKIKFYRILPEYLKEFNNSVKDLMSNN